MVESRIGVVSKLRTSPRMKQHSHTLDLRALGGGQVEPFRRIPHEIKQKIRLTLCVVDELESVLHDCVLMPRCLGQEEERSFATPRLAR